MSYLFFVILSIVTCVYLFRKRPAGDIKFLIYLFAASMALRCLFVVISAHMAYLHHENPFLSGDSLLYSRTALIMADEMSRGVFVYKYPHFGINLYTYVLAIFYRVFGQQLVSSMFINCYLGSALPIAVYFLSLRLLNDRYIGKIAAVVCAFYPSLFFWSVYNIKEPLIILTVCLGFYILIKSTSLELRVRDIFIFILFSVMVAHLQVMYIYQVGVLALAMIFSYCSRTFKTVVSVFLPVLSAFVIYKKNLVLKFIRVCEMHQWNVAISDKAGYYLYTQAFMKALEAGHVNFLALLFIYLKGMAHFLFAPFPWEINSFFQLLVLPQLVFWYGIIILSVIGFVSLVKRKPLQNIAAFAFIFIGMSAWAFIEGNVGAAFRHRDHFVPIMFLYAGFGLKCLAEKWLKKELPES